MVLGHYPFDTTHIRSPSFDGEAEASQAYLKWLRCDPVLLSPRRARRHPIRFFRPVSLSHASLVVVKLAYIPARGNATIAVPRSDSRPSINNDGNIAFDESINFDSGIFVGREGTFQTIAEPDPNVFVRGSVLNDEGTAAFYRSFFDEASQQFVDEIVTGSGDTLTTVADTRGEFGSFGFRPPSLNNQGDVALLATLDDGITGIFVGSDPVTDRMIATGDTLDGSIVQNLTFCEEELSDSGELRMPRRMRRFRQGPTPWT